MTSLKISLAMQKKERLEELERQRLMGLNQKWELVKEEKRHRQQRYNETYQERMCCMLLIKLVIIH